MIRKMKTGDVPEVHKVLAQFAGEGKLLARSLSELYTNIRDTFVAVDRETGRVIGCCSLHVVWEDLAQFDHQRSPDREGLFLHCVAVVEYLCKLGFRGFRCDAAYQLPNEVWRRLIAAPNPGSYFEDRIVEEYPSEHGSAASDAQAKSRLDALFGPPAKD